MIARLLTWIVLLPVQFLLLVAAGLAEFVALLLGTIRRSFFLIDTPHDRCSIVILNWNGRELLEECLPAVVEAIETDGGDHEVLVVDNGSSDDSVGWIRQHFSGVRILELDRNLGFGEGNNRGVAAARHNIVVLLNNDMVVDPSFLAPLLEPFADPDVFAVSAQILFPDGERRQETGNADGRFENGHFHLSHEPVRRVHDKRRFLPVLWAGGGSSAFRRDYFLRLKGFAPIFSPCYVEDTDLSYRAWRRGLRVLFAAASQVVHKHRSSSLRRFSEGQIQEMIERRKLWYLWRNFQLSSLLSHFLLYPFGVGRAISPAGYLRALARAPEALFWRACEPARRYTDRQFLEWVKRPLAYLNFFHPDRHRQTEGLHSRVLIASAYLPHLGRHGGAGRVFQLLRRVSRKHRLTLVSFVETRDELEQAGQAAPFCQRLETVLRRQFEPVSPYLYEPFEEFNCANFRESLEGVLDEEDFDLVHFEWTQMVQYADLVPGIPKLVTEIEVNYAAHHSLVAVETKPWKRVRRYYNTLQTLHRELQMCRRTDGVVCVTDTDAAFLAGYIPDSRLHVVNTGVDTRYFTPGSPDQIEPDSLVYVGAFRHEPNVDAMLYFQREVFPLLLESRPETHLYIVGSSPPPEIRRLANHPNVTVTGFVEDIREYYHRAQVVIVPLRTGVGIRGKILEGWAAEKAMVATSLACLGIRAGHGENLLIADDPAEFALWTLALLRSPEHCRRLGAAGRKTAVQHYEWDRLAGQLSDLYEGIALRDSQPEGEQRL